MKILELTTHLEMGGISIYVTDLARALVRRGHRVFVASNGGLLEKRLVRDGIPHRRIPCGTSSELNPVLWGRAFPQLLRLIRQEKPDLLHAHTRVTQVLSWALYRLTKIPFVTTCHGIYSPRFTRRFFGCWGRAVMAVSETTQKHLVAAAPWNGSPVLILVRNGIDVDRFMEPVSPGTVAQFKEAIGLHGTPVVGTIARLSPIKGQETLLKALPFLLKSSPQLHLLLVGDGPTRPGLIRLAYALGVADHVVMTHSVEDTRIPLATMDCFVAPSLQEGFGLAIVEAMAAGVPVVASNVGGLAEIIEEGRTGFLVPSMEPQAFVQSITTILANAALREKMVRQARQEVCRRFDLNRVAEEVEAVYVRAVR